MPSATEQMPRDLWARLTPEEQLEFILTFVKNEWVVEYFRCAGTHEGLVDWYLREE